ncbi:MAG TPA: PPC domain-containing DNA-binding protein [Rhizobium sp.]
MKSRLFGEDKAERSFILVLDNGEEAFQAIGRFAEEQQIAGASLTAIGAFSRATIGFFDFASKSYRKIPVEEQCEALSAIGDIALTDDGKPSLHLHVVLGLSDGSTRGGHFMEGTVHPTLEIVIRENPVHLCRRKKPELGIALIDLDA